MVKQKYMYVRGFLRHTEFKSGLYFWSSLFFQEAIVTVQSYLMVVLASFRKTTDFWVKLGSQIFQNQNPC